MVYRFVKKASRFTSFIFFLIILWLLYLLYTRPPKALPIIHSKVHDPKKHEQPDKPVVIISDHGSLIKQLLSNTSDFNHLNSTRGKNLLSRIKTNCKYRICTEFITRQDHRHFKYCVHKTWKVSLSKYREPLQSHCVFINGSRHFPVGLASYPGSGNTWVRGLLQKVTGLCIGGIYCDTTLRKNGYPGESMRSGTTFMVKTHQVDPRWEGVVYPPNAPFTYFEKLEDVPVFSSGVFILRNPFHAMVAEYKRQFWESEADNHVNSLGKAYFGEFVDLNFASDNSAPSVESFNAIH